MRETYKINDPIRFDFSAVFAVDDYLYFYRESLTDERTEKEVNALVRLLELDKPKQILDLACGFGRHTNRLAGLGHTMTGIDISPGFLEIAKADAKERGVEVRYEQQDMRHITFNREFDRVMLLFTSFGYFSDEENLQVLMNVRNALKPGGSFIVDMLNRDTFPKTMMPFDVHDKEGNLMIDRMSFNPEQSRFINKRIIIRDGKRKDLPFFVRLFDPTELETLFNQAGLMIRHIYDGWDGNDLTSETSRLVVISERI